MDSNLMHRLRPIGLTPAMAQGFTALGDTPGQPMRVLEVHRETVRVTDGLQEYSARLLPGLQRALGDAAQALTVGDWVWSSTMKAMRAG